MTERGQSWGPLALILLLALGLRAAVALVPSLHHPDETFQYLEQAHRLVFGVGVVPWEYRYGMRSWLVPLVLSLPMRLGGALAPETGLYLDLTRASLVILSLGVVIAAAGLGRRVSALHGLFAGLVTAIWVEFIYFAPHALTESLFLTPFLIAALLLQADRPFRWSLIIAGALLGLAVLLRFHYVPAIAVLVMWTCRLDIRARWSPLLVGGIAALAIGVAVDVAMGQTPFGWLIENFRQNIVHDRAAGYGVSGPLTYFGELGAAWGLWLGPILFLALIGARRYPALFWAAAVNLAVHMAIGHKEYRFILLTTAILVILAAIGSADAVRWGQQRLSGRCAKPLSMVALLLWVGASANLASRDRMRDLWRPNFLLAGFAEIGRDPAVCGLATHEIKFWQTGGYTWLHRPIPLYEYDAGSARQSLVAVRAALVRDRASYNAILAPGLARASLPDYRMEHCDPDSGICLFRRPGACDPRAGATHEFNRLRVANDE